jgi:hypothetical protein
VAARALKKTAAVAQAAQVAAAVITIEQVVPGYSPQVLVVDLVMLAEVDQRKQGRIMLVVVVVPAALVQLVLTMQPLLGLVV